MQYYPFPALLTATYNDTRIFGSACLCGGQNALDFSGEFIPLLPLGSPAAIQWMHGTESMATFLGEVYLSSPTLMRLVGIRPELIQAARSTFAVNTQLPACLKTGRRPGTETIEAEILYLSTGFITLKTAQAMEAGKKLYLNCEVDFLTLDELGLQVQKSLGLRRMEHLLFCSVLPGGNDNLIALSAYSARLPQLET